MRRRRIPLSVDERRILGALRSLSPAGLHRYTEDAHAFASMTRDVSGRSFVLGRLCSRRLVTGEGRGRFRSYAITERGREALDG